MRKVLFFDIYHVIINMSAPLEHMRLKSLKKRMWFSDILPVSDILPFFGVSLKLQLDAICFVRFFALYGYNKTCKFLVLNNLSDTKIQMALINAAIFSGNFQIYRMIHEIRGGWGWDPEWLKIAIRGNQQRIIEFFLKEIYDLGDKLYFLKYAKEHGFQEDSEVYQCLDKVECWYF